MPSKSRIAVFAAFIAVAATPPSARAQDDFYRGKTIQIVVGFGAGGGYDLWARTLARHLGKHIPGNPAIVTQNAPGAGSLTALSRLYNTAPRDGTVIAAVARGAVLGPLVGVAGARFDPQRLSWIGTTSIDTNLCIAKSSTRVKTAADLRQHELIVGDTGPGSGTYLYPRGLRELIGLQFKAVRGFPSTSDVFLAIERGEVEGVCEAQDSIVARRPDWIATGKVSMILQGGAEPNPELKNVPYVLDLARNADEREEVAFLYAGEGVGRPYVAPPELPAGRLALLRAAFDAALRDPALIADAKAQHLDPKPRDGAYLDALVKRIYTASPRVVERVGKLLR